MDDDGSKNLDYREFKKGIHDFGVALDEDVSLAWVTSFLLLLHDAFKNIYCFTNLLCSQNYCWDAFHSQ